MAGSYRELMAAKRQYAQAVKATESKRQKLNQALREAYDAGNSIQKLKDWMGDTYSYTRIREAILRSGRPLRKAGWPRGKEHA